jgi:hypothetical protein
MSEEEKRAKDITSDFGKVLIKLNLVTPACISAEEFLSHLRSYDYWKNDLGPRDP